jgi:5-hydroxyisourate hydrolase
MNRICLLLAFSWMVGSALSAGGEADVPSRSPITVHVLDTTLGKPAAGLTVVLERAEGKEWRQLGSGKTDAQGRIDKLLSKDQPVPTGVYRLTFESGA